MSHHHIPSNVSGSPWVVAPSYANNGVGSISSWGTIPTSAPPPKSMGSSSAFSVHFNSPAQTSHSLAPSLGQVGPSPQWHAESLSSHPSYSPFVASSRSSEKSSSKWALIPSLSSTQVDFPGPDVNNGPVLPPPHIEIIPCLTVDSSSRVYVDFAHPLSMTPRTYNSHPSMMCSAFNPSMTYAQVIIHGPSKWILQVHTGQPLTVYGILSKVYHFLQQADLPQDALSSRMRSPNANAGEFREQSSHRDGYGSGVRRIDLLGPRRFLYGFAPSSKEGNTWNLYFCMGQ